MFNEDEVVVDANGNPVEAEATPTEPQETVGPTEPTDPGIVVDPEPEPGGDPDPKAEPATDPYQEQFAELGLGRQFRGGVSEALSRIPDMNRYLDSLERTTKEQQRELDQLRATPQGKPEPVDPDVFREQFEMNPLGALGTAGFATKEDLARHEQKLQAFERQQAERAFADTVGTHPELKDVASALRLGRTPLPGQNPLWDEIGRELAMRPGLRSASDDAVLDLLLPIAKARVEARKPPPVKAVPAGQKAGATTTGSGGERFPTGRPDMSAWTPGQIEKWYTERGLVGA